MNIYVDGYSYKHDIFELIRANLNIENINFIENEKIDNIDIFMKKIYIDGDNYILIQKGNYKKLYRVPELYGTGYSIERRINITRKKALSILFKDIYNIKLQWGILTGIRPMKVLSKLKSRNLEENYIFDILNNEYLISKEKIKKMFLISKIQNKTIESINQNALNIYINIPFCPSVCKYCSFASKKVNDYKEVELYLSNLLKELFIVSNLTKKDKIPINTIYIGGGTPTVLKDKDLNLLLNFINNNFKSYNEFTVEGGREDTLTKSKLLVMKENNVNRISINPQTMNEKTLKSIGRKTSIKRLINLYSIANDIGFDIINMDLIVGLPGENIEEFAYSLKEISKLNPDNVTIHSLALKKGSSFYKNNIKTYKNDLYYDLKLDKIIEKYLIDELNMNPYYLYRQKLSYNNMENIGYAKLGKESIYNIVMMEEIQNVIGLGAKAVTKINHNDKIKRIPNLRSIYEYNLNIDSTLQLKKKLFNLIRG